MRNRIWSLWVWVVSLPLGGAGCELGVQPAGAPAYPPPPQAYAPPPPPPGYAPPPQHASPPPQAPPPAQYASAPPQYASPPPRSPPQPATYRDAQNTSVQFAIGDAAFADRVVAFEEGAPATQHRGYKNPQTALGPPAGDRDDQVITLGCGGRLTLEFADNALYDGPGPDLHVFEVGPHVEGMEVEISADGHRWLDVGAVKGQPASVDIHRVARPGAEYRFVRITDLKSACGSDHPGADIDAVGTIAGRITSPPPQYVAAPPPPRYPPLRSSGGSDAGAGGISPPPATYRDAQGASVRFGIGDAAFADRLVAFEEGRPATEHNAARNPQSALGPPEGSRDEQGITLGCGGRLTVEFTNNVLLDGPGPDLHVFETGPQVEAMEIEISADGQRWLDVGAVRGQPASVDIHRVAHPGAEYRFVRITDLQSACGSDYPGADVDAVGTIAGRIARP